MNLPILVSRSFVLFLLITFPLTLCASTHRLANRQCGSTHPSHSLRAAHSFLHWAEPLDNDLHNASTVRARQQQHHPSHHDARQATNPLYTIDTYFHIIADNASSSPSSPGYITDTMIQNQFSYLAKAYTNASIAFNLVGTDRTTNDLWAANGDDTSMKSALRKGTYSTLNVYFQSNLQTAPGTPGVPAGSTLLGFCSLPAAGVTTTTPTSDYVSDGCNVLSGTMPGGSVYGYNLGGSVVHEIGHWNGLLHTFQDNSCDATDYGDYVADTPQERTSTSKC